MLRMTLTRLPTMLPQTLMLRGTSAASDLNSVVCYLLAHYQAKPAFVCMPILFNIATTGHMPVNDACMR